MGSSSPNRKLVYDEIRKSWVKATPEEVVRQQWLRRMVKQLAFPHELLVVEKEIKELPYLRSNQVPDRRVDILCYGKETPSSPDLFPLLLVECKADSLTDDAVNQVIGYNHHVGARFIAVLNLQEVRLGAYDATKNKYAFCSFLPPFKELMQWFKR